MSDEYIDYAGDAAAKAADSFVSSPPPADLPPQELQDSKSIDISGPFDPEMIAYLPKMSIQHLSKLEDYIGNEFASLAREYVTARKARVQYMLKAVEHEIKKFQHNDTSWSKLYNQQVQRIETLTNFTENNIIKANTSTRLHGKLNQCRISEFNSELEDLIADIELPLHLDDVFEHRLDELPFAEYFREIINLHKGQLDALLRHIQYQSGMTESITEKNREILWNQYRHDVLEYKGKAINQICNELEELHKEYYGVSSSSNMTISDGRYYRSVVPIEMSKAAAQHSSLHFSSIKNHDMYHGVDNVYFRNNRIEITDSKLAAQRTAREFADQQKKYKIPQLDTVSIKLGGCFGATKDEMESDLVLIRLNNQISSDKDYLDDEMIGEDLEFSSYSHEVSYDSEEEEYLSVLNLNRQPTNVSRLNIV